MAKDYKNYNFNNKDDYSYVFYSLIVRAYKHLRQYRWYQDGLERFLIEMREQNVQYVDERIDREWHDKMLGPSRGLITTFVDEASGAMSYVMLRKKIARTSYHIEELDKEVESDLAELRKVRNWSYHLPQTDLVAQKETFYKNIPSEYQKFLTYSFNPLRIGIEEQSSIQILESLFLHTERRIGIFERLLECMIKDFEVFLGEKITIVEIPEQPVEFLNESFAAAQLSMAMNNRKYDGSDEAYEKITFQKPAGKE